MSLIYTPTYFTNFTCSNTHCPDTCCKGLDIELDSKSIEVYKGFTGKLKELVEPNIDCVNGRYYLKKNGNQCVFLTDNKLCQLQLSGGEAALCYTCRVYPRIEVTYKEHLSLGLSLSCPIACNLILNCYCDSYPFFTVDEEKELSDFAELLNNELFSTKETKQFLEIMDTREFNHDALCKLKTIKNNIRNLLSSKATFNLCRYFYFVYSDTFGARWKNISYWFIAIATFMIDNNIFSNEECIYKLAKDVEHCEKNIQDLSCKCFCLKNSSLH